MCMLNPVQITVNSTSQHSICYHMEVRWCIPPVNTVGGQMVHSTSQHSTTWWSVRAQHSTTWWSDGAFHQYHSTTWWSDGAFHQSTQYHMMVRCCIPPVPQYHMVVRWCIPPVPQYHMVVRSCIPLVSTVGGRLCIPLVNTIQHDGQTVHSTNQHSTTWWSAGAFHQ